MMTDEQPPARGTAGGAGMIYGVRAVFGGFIPLRVRCTRHSGAIRAIRLHLPFIVGHRRPRMVGPRPRMYYRKWHAPYATVEMSATPPQEQTP